jgi:hypothetical protein
VKRSTSANCVTYPNVIQKTARGPEQIELQIVRRDASGTSLDSRTVTVTAQGTDRVLVAPDQVTFGRQRFETFETRTFSVENTTERTVTLTTDIGLPDDFSHLIFSTCGLGDNVLAPHERCAEVVGFRPTPFFAGLETATIVLTARGSTGLVWEVRTVVITGRGA